MSSASLADARPDVDAAWETKQEVFFARVDPRTSKVSMAVSPPGGGGRKHPTVAGNARGEVLLAWAEGIGWQRGGSLAWQVFDREGQPVGEVGRVADGIPTWGLSTVAARPDGSFVIVH